MQTLTTFYALFVFCAGCWFLFLSCSNILFFWRSRVPKTVKKSDLMVSVLIPARNEEKRIGTLLEKIFQQDYPHYEVLIIDDNSTDGTWALLESIAVDNPRLRIIKGEILPERWKGKPFALSQIASYAKGDIFLFLDADMEPKKNLISWALNRIQHYQVDSFSAYPQHRAKSISAYLAFPLIYIVNIAFMPFWLISRMRTPLLSHAIGQIMVFRREAYQKSGGFAAVHDEILEDIQMGRVMKRQGFRHIFLDAKDVLSGYMYESWAHLLEGLKRSIFVYFDKKIYPLIILSLLILAVLVMPSVLLPHALLSGWSHGSFLLLGNVGIFLSWALTLYDRRIPWYVPFFFPFQFAFIVVLAWISLWDELSGRGYQWKDRKIL